MCGIVGYVGQGEAAPILLEGLRRLEYRGYDSAGIAVHDGRELGVVRAVGKLSNLAQALDARPLLGTTGIGHTRWATHGRPSEPNAHPHRAGDVVLVHNGIIENHVELRRELIASGVTFSSDTDTEIVAHLVSRALDEAGSLFAAVRRALQRLRGAYALAVMSRRSPERLVVAKSASPLVLGVGQGEMLCGSDIPALLQQTRRMLFLEDGEIAELTAESYRIETLEGEPVQRAPRQIDWNPVQAEKGGYKHFMLKEVFEQPRAVEDTLRGRVRLGEGRLVSEELGLPPEVARRIKRVYLMACGTSYHACLNGRYWIEALARVPAQTELASEVRYREPVFSEDDLVVAVSQSGETADTLAALRTAKEAGAYVLSIANVVDSAIPRLSDGALYTHAGPEIGVASTKCFTTQLVALSMLAIELGLQRGALAEERAKALLQALVEVPEQMRRALERASDVQAVARRFVHAEHVLFLGRGRGFPIALEGALKLKEISYAHAEGYAAGEMKHGPIALIDEHMPVVVVMPRDEQYEKTASNVQEIKARQGQVIGVVTEGDRDALELVDHALFIPEAAPEVLPLITVVPLQLLAYYIADLKGTDVDQPRNLAKTVTVE
ncbi:MAG: glutamine--fructose-6-phosphate transaminase (isomerizing) [Polyangiaceae bacterium]|nr:glutamine--fructose-6-phosphate transaminase (isomerizing) [Polyangiaceae bacterium]MCW5789047.1 glutamine--fructose-6-phosphate transaminase (isomerizing) [Polyangiaceae bacterium]